MAPTKSKLDSLVLRYAGAAYADATKSTYRSQLKAYLQFCSYYGYHPVPANPVVVCRYVAYLAMTHTYSSIKQYLNVVRILHVCGGFSNPITNHTTLQVVLKGVQRIKGDTAHRKPPMTLVILKKLQGLLKLNRSFDAVFWATCLLAFFGMLRLSSLFPPANVPLLISCVQVYSWGLVISFQYSKTIQFKERRSYVALPWSPSPALHPLPWTGTAHGLEVGSCHK